MTNVPKMASNHIESDCYRVGNYMIYKKHIGEGASSRIYRGYEINTKVDVAIKEIKEIRDHNSKQFTELFKNEIQIAKSLKHPNIVEFYDAIISEDHKSIYIVLEYSSQGDFHKWLGGRCIKEVHCKNYMKQLASGLKYLHDNKITHRDLKPQNILMFGNTKIKITDFGYAKYTNNNLSQTFCGSPLYMAPEVWKKDSYDDKSDLWSAGAIMYEMITGQVPFKASDLPDLMKKIKAGNIKFPKKVTFECLDLLKGLLEINPKKRISWEKFFNHPWFSVDDLLIQENHLLNFSITNSMSIGSLPTRNSALGSIFEHQEVIEDSFKKFSFHLSESLKNITSPPKNEIKLPPTEEENELFYSLDEEIDNNHNNQVIEDDRRILRENRDEDFSLKKDSKKISMKDMASQTEIDQEFSMDMRDMFESNRSIILGLSQNSDLNQSHFNNSRSSQVSSTEIMIEETGDKFVLINTAPINITQSNPESRRHQGLKGVLDSFQSLAKDSYEYIADHIKSI